MIGAKGIDSESNRNPVILTLDSTRGRIEVHGAPRSFEVDSAVTKTRSLDDAQIWLSALTTLLESTHFSAHVAVDTPLIIRVSEVGLVCLDHGGSPVYPVLWAHDERSQDDATWCRKKYDDSWWMNEVGLVPQAHHLVTKMSWLHRTEPAIWESIQQICSVEDFVIARLVSESSAPSMRTRADLVTQFGIWSQRAEQYSTAVLALIDGQRDWSGVLPAVSSAGIQRGMWRDYEIWS